MTENTLYKRILKIINHIEIGSELISIEMILSYHNDDSKKSITNGVNILFKLEKIGVLSHNGTVYIKKRNIPHPKYLSITVLDNLANDENYMNRIERKQQFKVDKYKTY
jgi:hypothetical protein